VTKEIQHYRCPHFLAVVTVLLLLTTISVAQGGLIVPNDAKQKWATAEAGKVYLSLRAPRFSGNSEAVASSDREWR